MTVCMHNKGLYVSVPGFFPCTAKELPSKMAALAQHVKHIEQVQARHRQQAALKGGTKQ